MTLMPRNEAVKLITSLISRPREERIHINTCNVLASPFLSRERTRSILFKQMHCSQHRQSETKAARLARCQWQWAN